MNNQRKKSYKILTINGLKISYQYRSRLKKGPKVAIIFLSGYKSDMLGTKATFLDTLSKKIGYEYLRFDYSGHGSSEGKIEKRLISDWVNESYLLIKKKLQIIRNSSKLEKINTNTIRIINLKNRKKMLEIKMINPINEKKGKQHKIF